MLPHGASLAEPWDCSTVQGRGQHREEIRLGSSRRIHRLQSQLCRRLKSSARLGCCAHHSAPFIPVLRLGSLLLLQESCRGWASQSGVQSRLSRSCQPCGRQLHVRLGHHCSGDGLLHGVPRIWLIHIHYGTTSKQQDDPASCVFTVPCALKDRAVTQMKRVWIVYTANEDQVRPQFNVVLKHDTKLSPHFVNSVKELESQQSLGHSNKIRLLEADLMDRCSNDIVGLGRDPGAIPRDRGRPTKAHEQTMFWLKSYRAQPPFPEAQR